MPPVAVNVCVYAEPLPPSGRAGEGGVIETGGTMVMVKVRVAVCCATPVSMTCAINGKLPARVGVPVIAPDAAFNCRPGGSEPEVIVQLRAPALPPSDINAVL